MSKWVGATTYCLRAGLELGRVVKRLKITIDHKIHMSAICSMRHLMNPAVIWGQPAISHYYCGAWKRKWQPTPVFLLGNASDRGAWQATVHGVRYNIATNNCGASSMDSTNCILEGMFHDYKLRKNRSHFPFTWHHVLKGWQ